MTDRSDDHVHALAERVCPGASATTVWTNPIGGRTLRLADAGADRYLKVAPTSVPASHQPHHEAERIAWVGPQHGLPTVLGYGQEHGLSWMVTAALPGMPASDPCWRSDPPRLVWALGRGARAFHDQLADRVTACPWRWDIAHRIADGRGTEGARRMVADAPAESDPVVAHGDLCAPNLLLSDDWSVTGYVDLGKLGVADRPADLGAHQWSLEFNGYGDLIELFLTAYGWQGDPGQVQWYRDFYAKV